MYPQFISWSNKKNIQDFLIDKSALLGVCIIMNANNVYPE